MKRSSPSSYKNSICGFLPQSRTRKPESLTLSSLFLRLPTPRSACNWHKTTNLDIIRTLHTQLTLARVIPSSSDTWETQVRLTLCPQRQKRRCSLKYNAAARPRGVPCPWYLFSEPACRTQQSHRTALLPQIETALKRITSDGRTPTGPEPVVWVDPSMWSTRRREKSADLEPPWSSGRHLMNAQLWSFCPKCVRTRNQNILHTETRRTLKKEKMRTGCLYPFQEFFQRYNENQRHGSSLSKRTEENQLPHQWCRQQCRPRFRRCTQECAWRPSPDDTRLNKKGLYRQRSLSCTCHLPLVRKEKRMNVPTRTQRLYSPPNSSTSTWTCTCSSQATQGKRGFEQNQKRTHNGSILDKQNWHKGAELCLQCQSEQDRRETTSDTSDPTVATQDKLHLLCHIAPCRIKLQKSMSEWSIASHEGPAQIVVQLVFSWSSRRKWLTQVSK